MTTSPTPPEPSSEPPTSQPLAENTPGKSRPANQVSPSSVVQAYSANVQGEKVPAPQLEELSGNENKGTQQQRRRLVPLLLFLATCISTFWVGSAQFQPLEAWSKWGTEAFSEYFKWQDGLVYMVAVLAILVAHEMGHFLFTLRYKISASYPIFIPIPFNPIGTMGAVIGMDGLKATRKQLFDLALAGPVAGLVVAIPILWLGIMQLDLDVIPREGAKFYNPILIRWIYEIVHPDKPVAMYVHISQLNPLFMAGWVGFLITGLNMLPISQLDGGHVTYAVFGKRARTIARGFLVIAIIFVIGNESIWTLMLILVILMGVDHPPTSDDSVELNEFRWRIGVLSLAIPILCFPIHGIEL